MLTELSAAAPRAALRGTSGSRMILRILFHCRCASRPAPKAQRANGSFLRAEQRGRPGAGRCPQVPPGGSAGPGADAAAGPRADGEGK